MANTEHNGHRPPITAPFQQNVLEIEVVEGERTTKAPELKNLFPATYRCGDLKANIGVPKLNHPELCDENFLKFLEEDLNLQDIEKVKPHMFFVGRPSPPRPLTYQNSHGREITITEQMGLHLVWYGNRMFVKPIPEYLLDPSFWTKYLMSQNCADERERRAKLASVARGFLFSYTALIAYPSDHRLAQLHGLLPASVTWEKWKNLSAELVQHHCYASLHWRFLYGELRLGRLNKVCTFRLGQHRGYSSAGGPTTYGALLRDNLGVLASLLGYVVIVLTAMQVGLATDRLEPNTSFQNASYGFTVFSIISPLLGVAMVFAFALPKVVRNWNATNDFEGRRFTEMGVESWRIKRKRPEPDGG